MVQSLVLTAWRSLKKNPFFSALNILGLAIGMTVFILIALYVNFEKSYEDFIPARETIFRVTLETSLNNELIVASAENYPGVGPALLNELPEITAYARLYNMGYKNNVIITYEEGKPDPIAFKHRQFLYADSSFLPMMGYTMLQGNASTALSEPFTAVISSTYAKKYFGAEDPIGKMLRMQDDDYNNELVKITGVFEDLPRNTHLKFDILFSYKTLFTRFERAPFRYDQSWQRKDMYTFISVRPDTDIKALEAKLPELVSKFKPENQEKNQRDVLSLQPLSSIHLSSNLAEEAEPNGNEQIVTFLGLIGIFVLIIAWINYVNLSTAKAMDRAKEVGVRKVMGAHKSHLINQFMAESAVVNLISLLLAVLLAVLLLPSFNSLSGLQLSYYSFLQIQFITLLATLWIVGTVFSGFYPAFILSAFQPVVVLKGKLRNSTRGILLRKSLVVLQFMASVALIAGTIIVYQQLNFMMSREIGVNINQVLVVERPGISPRDRSAFSSVIDVFRNELKKESTIEGVASSLTIPGKQREYKAASKPYGASDDKSVTVRFNSMDYDFLDVFKMELIAGRAFSPDFVNDQDTSAILTESAVKLLGFDSAEEAIGQTISIPDFQWHPIVVGVVNDYHQVSLKKSLDPTIFYCSPLFGEFYSIRVNTKDLSKTVDHAKQAWEKAFPGNPFDYFFLDDYFNKQYENEKRFGQLFGTFATLAVLVGCLGLFGLSAYTATQRTKEIGVRKVLGSSEQGIFYLLSQEYIKLVGMSILLACPLVWWGMKNWVESFPYQISISWFVFVIAGVIVLMVSLITVSFQTLKAAKANPIDSLRHE